MPNPTLAQIQTGTLVPPACYQTEQQRYEAFMAVTQVIIPTQYLDWIVQASTPAAQDQNKLWLRIDANGFPIGAYRWDTNLGGWDLWAGFVMSGNAAGAANAFTLTNAQPQLSLYDRRVIVFRSNQTITGPATLNVDGLGAFPIKKPVGIDLVSNDIATGQLVIVVWDLGNTRFEMISPPAGGVSLHGSFVDTAAGIGKNWTTPANVYSIAVECVGAGGGGGSAANCFAGGGGGYGYKRIACTPGQVFVYDVGAKGLKQAGGPATAGGNTRFDTGSGTPLTAYGGGAGNTGGAPTGGSFANADYGFNGQDGKFLPPASNEIIGGRAPFGPSNGATFDVLGYATPAQYGGGGSGDTSASGGAQDGADGVLLIHW